MKTESTSPPRAVAAPRSDNARWRGLATVLLAIVLFASAVTLPASIFVDLSAVRDARAARAEARTALEGERDARSAYSFLGQYTCNRVAVQVREELQQQQFWKGQALSDESVERIASLERDLQVVPCLAPADAKAWDAALAEARHLSYIGAGAALRHDAVMKAIGTLERYHQLEGSASEVAPSQNWSIPDAPVVCP